jgi:uncharacterized protein
MKLNRKVTGALFFVMLSIGVIGFLHYETGVIKTVRINLEAHAPVAGAPVRLVQISDLHYKGNTLYLEHSISLINSQKPDIVFITGDIVESVKFLRGAINALSGIKSPYGIFIIPGNWEYWSGLLPEQLFEFREKLSATGMTFLKNQGMKLSIRGNRVDIFGLDDWFSRDWVDPSAFFNSVDKSYRICLAHEPVMFDICTNGYDIMLSGHSHGGQVVAPLIGPLWLPEGCGGYWKGMVKKNNRRLYVNSGLGTSIVDVRLFARPEITVFELR